MPDYQYVILEKDLPDGIATLTLNRPERRNALNDLVQDEIGDALEEVEAGRKRPIAGVLKPSGTPG